MKTEFDLPNLKIILITNSTLLHRGRVVKALELLDHHNGEIWAKLDAGTAAYFEYINQTAVPFTQIIDNLTQTAQKRPIVIQTLFTRVDGHKPPAAEIFAYAQRLNDIISAGGRISVVQLHTLARPPREQHLKPLPAEELDLIATEIQSALKHPIPIQTYYSPIE